MSGGALLSSPRLKVFPMWLQIRTDMLFLEQRKCLDLLGALQRSSQITSKISEIRWTLSQNVKRKVNKKELNVQKSTISLSLDKM